MTYSSVVDASLADVFSWHTRPGAITRLTPPWLPARVLSEASSLRDGQAVLGLPGGLRVTAVHQPADYDPPHAFADELASPLLSWRHLHQFSETGERATLVTDVVETRLPARVLRPMLVYRHRQLAADLAALARSRQMAHEIDANGPLTIAVTGSGGLIGTALTALLTTGGHQVIRLVRRPPRHAGERHWRPEDPGPDLLDGVDALIHLAGASIGGRFTPARKAEIRDSRILPTRRLAELAAASQAAASQEKGTLKAFVTASAIGIYGPDRGDEVLTEDSPRGEGFLADVVADWEDAARPAAAAGIRTVQVRTGIVQTPRGGMLRLLSPLFEAGLGGRLGSGKQWLAWIGLDDLLDVFRRAVLDAGLSGPVNAVAPEPVRNEDYTRTLASVLHRPAVLPVPGLGPRLLLGAEGAREIAQASQYVRPERLIGAGHEFRQPELEGALRHLFGRE
ncbi:MAG TPA: TIGR01777 family oxidoreductase [Streptosporangiaceae bacterium]|nr:TIGR01777 family oxidoreductase [Streptosporangiaceae bacterium]